MRENGAEYLVAKNRLFKIALKESGVEDNFDEILEGTTAFAFGYNDPVAPAKAVFDLSKAKAKAKLRTKEMSFKRMPDVANKARAPRPMTNNKRVS